MKKEFVLIGVGTFGMSVAKKLSELGQDLLVIDELEERVATVSKFVTHAVQMDATDEEGLLSLGVRNFDVGIVAIDDIESSIMITMLLKEMGVGQVIVKAKSEIHAKLLKRVGADSVVAPERDMGIRVANNLVSSNILDVIELSEDYRIVETKVIKPWVGKSLMELNFRKQYGVNIIAILGNNMKMNIIPVGEDVLKEDDALIMIGESVKIGRIEKEIQKNK